jgi:hypothetical protein
MKDITAMSIHQRIVAESAAPISETTPSLSQILQAHQKITDLVGTALPSSVIDNLREAAEEMLYKITLTRAASWEEFGRKVQLLVDKTTEESHEGWLTAVQEGVFWDLKHLNGESVQTA